MRQKQKGAARKIGRGKRPGPAGRRARYRDVFGPMHRLKRIVLNNGIVAARAWAGAHSHDATLTRMLRASTSTHVAQRLAVETAAIARAAQKGRS
jgi:hypothetical protein